MQKRIYLSGAICKKHESFCRSWRDKIKKEFVDKKDLIFFDPIEGKDLTKNYQPYEIYKEDMRKIRLSDIVIVEMNLDEYPYIGTVIEMQYAYFLDIPVYVWGSAHKNHYFLKVIETERYDNIGQIISLIRDFCYGKGVS